MTPQQRLLDLAVRLWPHASGSSLAVFWAFAERESWHPNLARPYAPTLWAWLSSRIPAPIEHLNHEPGLAILMLAILIPLVVAHLVWPKWYVAPLSIVGVFGWTIWGSVALGRLGVQMVS